MHEVHGPHKLHGADLAPQLHQFPGCNFNLVTARGTADSGGDQLEIGSIGHGPDRDHRVKQDLLVIYGVILDHAMTQLFHAGGRRLDSPPAIWVDGDAERRPGAPRDAHGSWIELHLIEEWFCRRRRPVGVSGGRSRSGVEECRAVADRPSNGMLNSEPGEGLASIRRERDPAPRRLEPEDPATGGGYSNRASAVAGTCGRHQPCRDGCSGAPTGTPCGPLHVPRVMAGSEQLGLRGRVVPEFRADAPPDDHQARVA